MSMMAQATEATLFDKSDLMGVYEHAEFWTSAQRQANRLHEVSYRACFKPQLPRYFIERFTHAGDVVYDPFAGRGTTAIESALLGRNVFSNDINPLSEILTRPRLEPPRLEEVESRLKKISRCAAGYEDPNLEMFFEKKTLEEIIALRLYLLGRKESGLEDSIDRWIAMVAITRLTGHSPGFFSVYSLPPNQAVSRTRQEQINRKRNQSPSYRDTHSLILKKSQSLLSQLSEVERRQLLAAAAQAQFFAQDAASTNLLLDESVQLIVTSPPFLDVVQYSEDNWMRAWFAGINLEEISTKITMAKTLTQWTTKMQLVLSELTRVLKSGGRIAFEVGEVRNGKINLEEAIIPLGLSCGLTLEKVLINEQSFTKTSNIWGIKNNTVGTNTNRIVLFKKT